MAKRKKFKARTFESRGQVFIDPDGRQRKDTSASIFESMLLSEAWKDLTDKQRVLYLVCKAQYYGHRKPRQDYDEESMQGDDCFYLSWHQVGKQGNAYQLYSKENSARFYKDMDRLVENGLIEKVMSGKSHKVKSVYRFSDKWRTWEKIN